MPWLRILRNIDTEVQNIFVDLVAILTGRTQDYCTFCIKTGKFIYHFVSNYFQMRKSGGSASLPEVKYNQPAIAPKVVKNGKKMPKAPTNKAAKYEYMEYNGAKLIFVPYEIYNKKHKNASADV